MKTILYNPIFINPQAYYVFPRLTRWLQPDEESVLEPVNYIGSIEVKIIAYGEFEVGYTRNYTNTSEIDFSDFRNSYVRISLFTSLGSVVLGEWKIGNLETTIIDPSVLESLKAVVICDGKTNYDSDRDVIRNLVDPDNPFVASNFAWKLNSGYGGYKTDFSSLPWRSTPYIQSRTDKKIVATVEQRNNVLYNIAASLTEDIPSFKVKLTTDKNVSYVYINSNLQTSTIWFYKSGIYELPKSYTKDYTGTSYCGFFVTGTVTIEQLPSHDGALVFDGVNDRVISTKTMQEMVGDTNAVTVVSMIHQISLHSTNTRNNYVRPATGSGYMFNNVETTGVGKTGIYGYSGSILSIRQLSPLLGDKADYSVASTAFNGDMPVFSVNGFIQGSECAQMSQIAWYWTIIANKVLTTDEIHQVIAYYNLDKHVKPDVYYDVKKQGLTNANHATFNDKLIDYSGNGHDMQLYNIGWSGGSGIGRYSVDFSENWIIHSQQTGVVKTATTVKVVGQTSNFYLICHIARNATNKFKVIVTGNKHGLRYRWFLADGTVKTKDLYSDGIYELEASESYDSTSLAGLYLLNSELDWTGLTVEILPYNDGSLVLDGVNDYGKVTGVPVYKDYTVVGEYIKDSSTVDAPFVSKSEPSPKGAFIMDIGAITYSFRAATAIVNPSLNIRYQTKYFYNGKAITAGTAEDSDTLYLGTMRNNDDRFANFAFNFLMTFPYSLDEFLIERQLKRHKLGTLHPDLIEFRPIVKSDGELKEIRYYLNGWSDYVYPGDYIPKGSTININFLGLNELVEFNKLKVQGKEVSFTQQITPSGLTYIQCSGIIYNKAPLKIEVSLDNYIRFEDIQQPYPFVFSFVNAETDEEYAWGDKIKYGTKLQIIKKFNLLVGVYKQTIDTMFTWNGNVIAQDTLMSKEFVVGKDKLVFGVQGLACEFTNEPNVIAAPQKLRLPNISYKRLGYIPDISGHGNNIKLYNSGYSGMSGANGYGFDFTKWNVNSATAGKIIFKDEYYVEYKAITTLQNILFRNFSSVETFSMYGDVDLELRYSGESTSFAAIKAGVPTKITLPKTGVVLVRCTKSIQVGDIITIQQVGLYDGAFCFDGVNDYGQIPTLTQGGKQVFMKLNRMGKSAGFLYDQRKNTDEFTFALSVASDSIAYNYRNSDELTYIDAIENKNVMTDDLKDVTHNITAINSNVTADNSTVPVIASSSSSSYFSKFAMYSFALFPEISDESEIIRFNEIMGIEGKYVEKPNYYWDTFGKKNTDADRDTIIDQVTKLPANALSLKNIAYEGMSGYDGYPVVFGAGKTWTFIPDIASAEYQYSLIANKVVVSQIYSSVALMYKYIKNSNILDSTWNTEVPSFRLKVTGLDASRFTMTYYYLASASAVAPANYAITSDGVHTLPKSFASDGSLTASDVWIGLSFRNLTGTSVIPDVNLTLEVLPDYENGLALDGVNDYLENTTLPALTDFTFITKRKNLFNTYADGTEYIRKGLDNNRKWALLGEYWYNGKCMNYVFNRKSNDITPFDLLGFITPTNYNGTTMSFSSGEVHEDSQGIYIGKSHWKGVFYKLMIFDKSINILSINMIKNLMNKDGIVDLDNPVFKNN